MTRPSLPDTVESVREWILIADLGVQAFQAQRGAPLLCVHCGHYLIPVSSEDADNVDGYSCSCGVEMTSLTAYQDATAFFKLLDEVVFGAGGTGR